MWQCSVGGKALSNNAEKGNKLGEMFSLIWVLIKRVLWAERNTGFHNAGETCHLWHLLNTKDEVASCLNKL